MTDSSTPGDLMEALPARQAAVAIPDILKGMYLMGNSPAKMAAYLALATFPLGEYVTQARLATRLTEMQKGEPGWTPEPPTLMGYCKNALQTPGFVEVGIIPGSKGKARAEAVRLLEKGQLLGDIIVGSLLPLELQSLRRAQAGEENVLFLQPVMGESRRLKDGRIAGTPSRLNVYDTLLKGPAGGMAQSELQPKSGLSTDGIRALVRDLSHLGIIHKKDDLDERRTLNLSEELLGFSWKTTAVSEELKTVIEAAIRLRAKEVVQTSAKDVLECAQQMRPDLSRDRMSELFTGWLRRQHNFIQEVKLSSNRLYHTKIYIPKEHRDYLRRLVRIRTMLVADGPKAESFRSKARKKAAAITSSAEQIALLLANSQNIARGTNSQGSDWTHGLALLIPPEGINTADLHQKVMTEYDRTLGYNGFRQRLRHVPGIKITEFAGRGRSGRALGLVTLDSEEQPSHKV